MTLVHDDPTMRAAFAPARDLEPTDAEIATVLSRAAARQRPPRPSRHRTAWPAGRRLAPVAGATLLLLGGGFAAAAPVRSAVDDVAGTFAGWFGDASQSVPGRPLASDEPAPDYLRDDRYSQDPRVIAEAGGYRLVVTRNPQGGVSFDLGDTGVGIGGFTAKSFADRVLYVLGPGALRHADGDGHVPLFGATARTVASVELTYASGPPLRVDGVQGGFVLLAEPDRGPRAVVARDAGGRELGRALVDDSKHPCPCIDWEQYLR